MSLFSEEDVLTKVTRTLVDSVSINQAIEKNWSQIRFKTHSIAQDHRP